MALGKKELDARFGARDLDQEQSESVDTIRAAVRSFATKLDKLTPDGRDKSLALTALEDVEMRAVKAISRGEQPAPVTATSSSGPVQVAAGGGGEAPAKLDLRTKAGREAKAAQEAAAASSTEVATSKAGPASAAAAARPRSRRAKQD